MCLAAIPSRVLTSDGCTAAAATLIRTCPGPAYGSGSSSTRMTSGPPNSVKPTAFTTPPHDPEIGHHATRDGSVPGSLVDTNSPDRLDTSWSQCEQGADMPEPGAQLRRPPGISGPP